MDALPGAGEAAGIDHRDEALQKLQIEHFDTIRKSTEFQSII
jgi:hypothetical protein